MTPTTPPPPPPLTTTTFLPLPNQFISTLSINPTTTSTSSSTATPSPSTLPTRARAPTLTLDPRPPPTDEHFSSIIPPSIETYEDQILDWDLLDSLSLIQLVRRASRAVPWHLKALLSNHISPSSLYRRGILGSSANNDFALDVFLLILPQHHHDYYRIALVHTTGILFHNTHTNQTIAYSSPDDDDENMQPIAAWSSQDLFAFATNHSTTINIIDSTTLALIRHIDLPNPVVDLTFSSAANLSILLSNGTLMTDHHETIPLVTSTTATIQLARFSPTSSRVAYIQHASLTIVHNPTTTPSTTSSIPLSVLFQTTTLQLIHGRLVKTAKRTLGLPPREVYNLVTRLEWSPDGQQLLILNSHQGALCMVDVNSMSHTRLFSSSISDALWFNSTHIVILHKHTKTLSLVCIHDPNTTSGTIIHTFPSRVLLGGCHNNATGGSGGGVLTVIPSIPSTATTANFEITLIQQCTPQELLIQLCARDEFAQATAVATKYPHDTDLDPVYKRQWESQPISDRALKHLAQVHDTSYVVQQALSRQPKDQASAHLLYTYALSRSPQDVNLQRLVTNLDLFSTHLSTMLPFEDFHWFKDTPYMQAAQRLAKQGKVGAVLNLLQATNTTPTMALLDSFLETQCPSTDYASLLPLTCESAPWYEARARAFDAKVGRLDHALDLLEFAVHHDIPVAPLLVHDVKTLYTLVYEKGMDDSITLHEWEHLSLDDRLRLVAGNAPVTTLGAILQDRFLPWYRQLTPNEAKPYLDALRTYILSRITELLPRHGLNLLLNIISSPLVLPTRLDGKMWILHTAREYIYTLRHHGNEDDHLFYDDAVTSLTQATANIGGGTAFQSAFAEPRAKLAQAMIDLKACGAIHTCIHHPIATPAWMRRVREEGDETAVRDVLKRMLHYGQRRARALTPPHVVTAEESGEWSWAKLVDGCTVVRSSLSPTNPASLIVLHHHVVHETLMSGAFDFAKQYIAENDPIACQAAVVEAMRDYFVSASDAVLLDDVDKCMEAYGAHHAVSPEMHQMIKLVEAARVISNKVMDVFPLELYKAVTEHHEETLLISRLAHTLSLHEFVHVAECLGIHEGRAKLMLVRGADQRQVAKTVAEEMLASGDPLAWEACQMVPELWAHAVDLAPGDRLGEVLRSIAPVGIPLTTSHDDEHVLAVMVASSTDTPVLDVDNITGSMALAVLRGLAARHAAAHDEQYAILTGHEDVNTLIGRIGNVLSAKDKAMIEDLTRVVRASTTVVGGGSNDDPVRWANDAQYRFNVIYDTTFTGNGTNKFVMGSQIECEFDNVVVNGVDVVAMANAVRVLVKEGQMITPSSRPTSKQWPALFPAKHITPYLVQLTSPALLCHALRLAALGFEWSSSLSTENLTALDALHRKIALLAELPLCMSVLPSNMTLWRTVSFHAPSTQPSVIEFEKIVFTTEEARIQYVRALASSMTSSEMDVIATCKCLVTVCEVDPKLRPSELLMQYLLILMDVPAAAAAGGGSVDVQSRDVSFLLNNKYDRRVRPLVDKLVPMDAATWAMTVVCDISVPMNLKQKCWSHANEAIAKYEKKGGTSTAIKDAKTYLQRASAWLDVLKADITFNDTRGERTNVLERLWDASNTVCDDVMKYLGQEAVNVYTMALTTVNSKEQADGLVEKLASCGITDFTHILSSLTGSAKASLIASLGARLPKSTVWSATAGLMAAERGWIVTNEDVAFQSATTFKQLVLDNPPHPLTTACEVLFKIPGYGQDDEALWYWLLSEVAVHASSCVLEEEWLDRLTEQLEVDVLLKHHVQGGNGLVLALRASARIGVRNWALDWIILHPEVIVGKVWDALMAVPVAKVLGGPKSGMVSKIVSIKDNIGEKWLRMMMVTQSSSSHQRFAGSITRIVADLVMCGEWAMAWELESTRRMTDVGFCTHIDERKAFVQSFIKANLDRIWGRDWEVHEFDSKQEWEEFGDVMRSAVRQM